MTINYPVVEHMDAGVRQKIIDDPNLAESHKRRVFTACASADNETEIERNFNAYAEKHRLIAIRPVKLDETHHVGHIKIINKVIQDLKQALEESDDIKQSTGVLKNRIRALALPDSSLGKKEAMEWFERKVFSKLPGYPVAGRPAWLFASDDGDARTLLDSVDNMTLPCRLGLPGPEFWGEPPYNYPHGLEFVGFAFSGDKIKNPKPATVLDNNYDAIKKIWVIGGLTQPLPHGPKHMKALGGLKEIVAEPPLFSTFDSVYVFEN